jgi:hypothetical protein
MTHQARSDRFDVGVPWFGSAWRSDLDAELAKASSSGIGHTKAPTSWFVNGEQHVPFIDHVAVSSVVIVEQPVWTDDRDVHCAPARPAERDQRLIIQSGRQQLDCVGSLEGLEGILGEREHLQVARTLVDVKIRDRARRQHKGGRANEDAAGEGR